MAVVKLDPDLKEAGNHPTSNKKVPKKKIVKVLLDSGSNRDLLFHKKGNSQTLPLIN